MNARALTLIPALALMAALAPAASAAPDPGETQYNQRCKACHVIAPGDVSGPIAPNLRGVVGRKAGTGTFKMYSPALKASGLTWTPANLEKYLTSPVKLVPGTRMVIGVSDPAQRKALLAWLAKQK